jgi:hypothetical protein
LAPGLQGAIAQRKEGFCRRNEVKERAAQGEKRREEKLFATVVMFTPSSPRRDKQVPNHSWTAHVLKQIAHTNRLNPSILLAIRSARMITQPVACPPFRRVVEHVRLASQAGLRFPFLKRGVFKEGAAARRSFVTCALHVASLAPETGTRFSWCTTGVFASRA